MVPDEDVYLALLNKSLNHYTPVSATSFSRLVKLARFQTLKKGDALLQVNQTAKRMHFVCSGLVVSQYLNASGQVHIKNFFLEGTFAASTVSLLLGKPSTFSLQTLEDTTLISFEYQAYKELIYAHQDLQRFYIAYLEQNWVIANEKRQLAFATQSATERYLTFLAEYPTLQQRVPQLHIASYLGITPTQLSRIRKEV